MTNDPGDTTYFPRWQPGQIPNNADKYFQTEISQQFTALITQYFHEMSFGEFVLLGDYYPQIMQVDYDSVPQGNPGLDHIYSQLNNLPGNDIITANGLSFNSDFDDWLPNTPVGLPLTKTSNGRTDLLITLWRVNSRYTYAQGFASGNVTCTIKSKTGIDRLIYLEDGNSDPLGEIKHEYAHYMYGGNEYHSGGTGASAWNFLSVPNTMGSLAYSATISNTYNGWERRRLGYKPQNSQHQIKCLAAPTNTEVNTDLTYGQNIALYNNEFILRDFVTTGDAIRVKLPYLKSESSSIKDQWIWIENRQLKEGKIDIRGNRTPRGIYAYMQVGKETMQGSGTFGEDANYTWLIHPYGNYDYECGNVRYPKTTDTTEFGATNMEKYGAKSHWGTIYIDTINYQNPFIGYGLNIEGAFDFYPNCVNNVTHQDKIFRNETLLTEKVVVNGVEYPSSYFEWSTVPALGTIFDAFKAGQKISLATNPSSTPLYTYKQRYTNDVPYSSKQPHDNNKIYLNGLSIEFVEQYANGDIKVRILWDNYDVDNNVRWCGNIVLNEKVNLLPGKTINLDYGLMPTRPVNPLEYSDIKVFNDPTVFTCNPGSEFRQQANSTVVLKNQSTLKLKQGSTYIIEDGATLSVKPGCKLETDPCSKIVINGTGKIIYEDGAISAIAPETVLDFEHGAQNFAQSGNTVYVENTLDIAFVLPPTYSVATYTNWPNASYQLTRNLTIQSGGTLRIFQGELKGFDSAKIIVKPGGKLIVDQGKITNVCNVPWQGIHLHGNPAVQQSAANQPVVELKNGAVIENAVHGVYAGDPTNPGTKGGGIVYANGATFRNCGTGIYLESFRNMVQGTTTELNNLSHVTKCTFETTADYLTLSNVAPVGVKLWGVKGIYIRGNSFVNQDFAAFENTKRGIGVSVAGASCSIKFYCNDLDCFDKVRNTFTNLSTGVALGSTVGATDVTIEDNVFTNNYQAVLAGGSYTGQAFFNSINLGTQGQYGFYVFNNNNFKIEENTVEGNYAGFGVAYDGSTVANELYKNTFKKLAYGVWARNNPNLKLTCNTFNDNTQQVYSTNNGISRFQGSSQIPAGNIFLPECSNSDREIKAVSQSLSISYYYKSGDASQQPLCVTSNFRLYSTANQNLCPTRHTGGGGPTEDLLLAAKTTMEGQEAELQSLVDGGNTDKTVYAIETVQEGEEISLMSDLLDKSPFLSETALVKTATEEEVLPEIVVANVLVANPQAAKSVEVQTALDNRPVPMPDYLRDAINEGLDVVSDKEVLERNLAETTLEKEQLLNDLIHLYKTDETTDRSAQTEALLLAENTLEYDYLAVENYLATERFNEAQQLFNALPVKYTLTEAQQAEYNAMEQIVTLLSVLNSKNYFLFNQEQKAELYTLAEDGQNRATMLARGILTMVDGASFAVPEIVIEETEGENKNQRIPTEQKPVFSFTVQPNPANDYFVVEYNLATKDFETAELRLFNNQGKQVYQQKLTKQAFQLLITTEHFEPGIYLCRLYKDSKEVGANPLVIKPNQLIDPQAVEQSEQLLEGQQFFLVYPNPTTVDVTVCSSRTQNCTIEVYDERGQVVNRLTKVSATNTINTRGLKPGVYHVRLVENGKVVETVKLVVQ